MNREKRRKFAKQARAKGIPEGYVDAYLAMMNSKETQDSIEEDMNVKVNIERVTSNKNYDSMHVRYKEFIQGCEGKVFTAHVEEGGLISLKENPEWLFWEGDLIKCRSKEAV